MIARRFNNCLPLTIVVAAVVVVVVVVHVLRMTNLASPKSMVVEILMIPVEARETLLLNNN